MFTIVKGVVGEGDDGQIQGKYSGTKGVMENRKQTERQTGYGRRASAEHQVEAATPLHECNGADAAVFRGRLIDTMPCFRQLLLFKRALVAQVHWSCHSR